MDNKETMYWLAVLQQANEGNKEALETLQQEDEVRIAMGQKPIKEELKEKVEETEDKETWKVLQKGKVIWERPKK